MRPHLHRPATSHRAAREGPEAERSLAEAWLGARHPLVRSLAAGAAQVVFACRIALLRSDRRRLCLELIAHGGAGLPLPCIQRRCRDLIDRRALERLDDLVRASVHPEPAPVLARSLRDRRVIRAVAADLREVAALLRGRPPAGISLG